MRTLECLHNLATHTLLVCIVLGAEGRASKAVVQF
jgi:hypothetical protein